MAVPLRVPKPAAKEQVRVPVPKPLPTFGYVQLPETRKIVGTGWIPDVPDLNDYTEDHPKIMRIAEKLGVAKKKSKGAQQPALPPKLDLRPWCSEVADQGDLGSCTANAAVGLVEYFENRAFNKHIDGSRLFVYKTTRDLMGVVGDTGADLRTTMAALVYFGVPPEKFWSYTTEDQPGPGTRTFDDEPTTFVYGISGNYQSTSYFCHDPFGKTNDPGAILNSVKTYLANGIPSMFGFWVFPSFGSGDIPGGIPYPSQSERATAGHAVVAVGYDNTLKIKNLTSGEETTGAFLIRNSWGTDWGEKGYGWLPYEYVNSQFASDFWSLLSMEWVDTGNFGLE